MSELKPNDFLKTRSIEDASQYEMIYLGPVGQEAMRRAGCSAEEIRKAATPTPYAISHGFVAEFQCYLDNEEQAFKLLDSIIEIDLVYPPNGKNYGTFDWRVTAVWTTPNGAIFVRAKTMGGPK